MKDREIVERIALRDEKALDFLYKKYYKKLFRFIRNKFSNIVDDDIKDICQETIIVFWEKCNKEFVLTCKLSSYLGGVANNMALKKVTRLVKFDKLDNHLDMPEKHFVDHLKNDTNKILNEAISNLDELDKIILTMFYFDKMSMQEISEKLNFSNSDVAKTRKYKAFKKLQAAIKTKYLKEELVY